MVEILVCLKFVPDTTAIVRPRADGKGIDPAGMKFSISPYDEFALEEALLARDALKGGKITAITAGHPRSEEGLRTALAMGADTAVFVKDPALEQADPGYESDILARIIKTLKYDLIFMGKQAIDDDSAQAPQFLAEHLNLPCVTMVRKIEISPDLKSIKVTRQIEGGEEVHQSSLPMIVAVGKTEHMPRLPTLPNIMKAKTKPITIMTLQQLGVAAPPASKVVSLSAPSPRKGVKLADGDTPEVKVDNLIKMLREEAKLF
jgi:electron transfer flavoprotein beta subunit